MAKTTWKEFFIAGGKDLHTLDAYARCNTGAWAKYKIEFHFGMGWLLTNLPWSEIRSWFSFADVRMPKDYITSKSYPYPEESDV